MTDPPGLSRTYHTWTDLNPHQKDFFIINHIGGDAKPAIAKFQELSGLAVHDQMTENNTAFRVVNFNSGGSGRHVDQHAVRLQRSTDPLVSTVKGAGNA